MDKGGPAKRRPAPSKGGGKLYAGGSKNFNAKTCKYRDGRKPSGPKRRPTVQGNKNTVNKPTQRKQATIKQTARNKNAIQKYKR